MIFNGYKVFVNNGHPKMQLSSKICEILSHGKSEFASEINAWLADRFGWAELIDDGRVVVVEATGQMHMNAKTYKAFQEALNGEKQNG